MIPPYKYGKSINDKFEYIKKTTKKHKNDIINSIEINKIFNLINNLINYQK